MQRPRTAVKATVKVEPHPGTKETLVEIAMRDTKFLELAFLAFTGGWGVWLLLPWKSFSTEAFVFMSAFGPEEAWGALAVCIAYLRFYGIKHACWQARLVSSFCGFLFWLTVTLSIGLVNPSSTGIPAYGFYTLLNAHVFLRILDGRPRGEE